MNTKSVVKRWGPYVYPSGTAKGRAYYKIQFENGKRSSVLVSHWMMAESLGGSIPKGFDVHHLDNDFTNDSMENLALRTKSKHSSTHGAERSVLAAGGDPKNVFLRARAMKFVDIVCKNCGEEFQIRQGKLDTLGKLGRPKSYCSEDCSRKGSRKVARPSKRELEKAVWEEPTSSLKARYGVSDVAIGKWCKQYGISKPPRGYWAKKQAGRI